MRCRDCGAFLRPIRSPVNGTLHESNFAPCPHCAPLVEAQRRLVGGTPSTTRSCHICHRSVPRPALSDHLSSHHLPGHFEDVSARTGTPAVTLHCHVCFKALGPVRYKLTPLLYQCVECHYDEERRRARDKAEHQRARREKDRVLKTKGPRPRGSALEALPAGPVAPKNRDRFTNCKGAPPMQGGRVSPR